MGKHARIAELEGQIETLKAQVQQEQRYRHVLETLSSVPEDAVCLYTVSGMRVQCECGKIIRAALQGDNQCLKD